MNKKLLALAVFVFPLMLMAQGPDMGPPPGGPIGGQVSVRDGGGKVLIRHEMGKWWQNSEIAKKLALTDSQIAKLNDTFYNHRLKLIDDSAAMEKADLKLQNLLDEDEPNKGQVSAQVDQVLAARGALEREYTMMNLDLREVLSVQQWKQLKSIRNERGPGDNVFFYRKFSTGGPIGGPVGGPVPPGAPAPPPPPDPGPDNMD